MTIVKINPDQKRVFIENERTTTFIEEAHDGSLFDTHYSNETGEQVYGDEKEYEQEKLFEFHNIFQAVLLYAAKDDLIATNSALERAKAVIHFDEYVVQ